MRGQGMGSSPRRLGRSSPGNKGAEAPLPRRIDSLPLEQVPTVRPRQRSQEVAMTAVTSLLTWLEANDFVVQFLKAASKRNQRNQKLRAVMATSTTPGTTRPRPTGS